MWLRGRVHDSELKEQTAEAERATAVTGHSGSHSPGNATILKPLLGEEKENIEKKTLSSLEVSDWEKNMLFSSIQLNFLQR